jgi:hypothetical protein
MQDDASKDGNDASKDGNDTNTIIIIRLPTKEQAKLSLVRWTKAETTRPAR